MPLQRVSFFSLKNCTIFWNITWNLAILINEPVRKGTLWAFLVAVCWLWRFWLLPSAFQLVWKAHWHSRESLGISWMSPIAWHDREIGFSNYHDFTFDFIFLHQHYLHVSMRRPVVEPYKIKAHWPKTDNGAKIVLAILQPCEWCWVVAYVCKREAPMIVCFHEAAYTWRMLRRLH